MKTRITTYSLLLAFVMSATVPTLIVWALGARDSSEDIEDLPHAEVGLILGTSPTSGNTINPYFAARVEAGAALYHSGKVKCLLVSGDNRQDSYNEPAEMESALIKLGVPREKIAKDFAGLRTLDSIARAQQIFQAKSLIIVSQGYHNHRALYLAKHYRIPAFGYNAKDVSGNSSGSTRELLARSKLFLDLYLLNTQPRHLGKTEPLPL